jgi:hypothetical protein
MKRFANKLINEAMTTLAAHGFDPVVANGGKHVKLFWIDAAGRRQVLTFSRTHSGNWRARAHYRTQLRRILRVNGMPERTSRGA